MEKKSFQLWKEAYEDEVRRILGYQRYSVSNDLPFIKLAEKWKDVDPVLFVQANFPPYRTSWKKNKSGEWVELKFPYPATLLGNKARACYEKHVIKRGITSALTRREVIINSVESGLSKMRSTDTMLTDYQKVWDLYKVGVLSPYLVLLLPGMRQWVQSQMRRKEIYFEEWEQLLKKEKVLDSYQDSGLNIELSNIIREAAW